MKGPPGSGPFSFEAYFGGLGLFGAVEDGEVLEFGVVGDVGAVGDVGVVGDDDGDFEFTELGVLGWEGVVGDVADGLLLFDVDWPPGAMDMRVRDELLGEDLPLVDGADDVAEFPLVDGAAGVVELDEGVELDGAELDGAELDGAELDGAELDGAELDDDCPLADEDAPPLAPLPPPEPPPDCAFAATVTPMAKATATAITIGFCMKSLRVFGVLTFRNPYTQGPRHRGASTVADTRLRRQPVSRSRLTLSEQVEPVVIR